MKIQISLSKTNKIADTINLLIKRYGKTPNKINNGDCEPFAAGLKTALLKNGIQSDTTYATDFFTKEDPKEPPFRTRGDIFDQVAMKKHWPKCVPLKGTTWGGMSIAAGSYGHRWVIVDKRHYDAECVEGVDNFFELPFFVKLAAYAKTKKNWGQN